LAAEIWIDKVESLSDYLTTDQKTRIDEAILPEALPKKRRSIILARPATDQEIVGSSPARI
jgi:hypothetical protein